MSGIESEGYYDNALATHNNLVDVTESPESDNARTECGVFAIYVPNQTELAPSIYLSLQTLQHRGQLSAGIALSTREGISVFHGEGHVDVALRHVLPGMPEATIGMGHTRYATSRNKEQPAERRKRAIMPIFKSTEEQDIDDIAVAANCNFKFARNVADRLGYAYDDFASDGDFVTQLIMDKNIELGDLEKAAIEVLHMFEDDAFSLSIMTKDKLITFQDPRGIRPLHYGYVPGGGLAVASERGALAVIGIQDTQEFEPGHMMVMDKDGLRTERVFEEKTRKLCVFESVYFSRPDNELLGKSVWQSRYDSGKELAKVAPVDVDFVAGMPESGLIAAYGYSQQSGIEYKDAYVKNRYVGRSFIEPEQELRDGMVGVKLLPLRQNVAGKRLVVVEDSIVRGTTSRRTVSDLRENGALEIHFRVASPPVKWPCFYAVDMKTREELLANQHDTIEAMGRYLGVDSIAFLPLDRLLRSVGNNVGELVCHACFSGKYPTEVPVNLIPTN